MTVARGARSSSTNATGPSTSSHLGGPPVQTGVGVSLPAGTGVVMQVSIELENSPRARGRAMPPGTTRVPSSLSRTDQRSEVHSSATPTNQPSTGTTIPPMGSRTSAATSSHPGRARGGWRCSSGRWPASAAMAAGSPSRASSMTSWSAAVVFMVVSSCVEEVVDGIAEAGPFGGEGVQGRLAGGGQVVVAAWWAAGGFAPGGRHQPVAAQAAEQRVDGAFAGHHPVDLAELADQVEAVAFAVVEQGQHAVLECSSAELGEEGGARGFYHAVHGTMHRLTYRGAGLTTRLRGPWSGR